MATKTFPTLYKKASTGATIAWTISVENQTVITRWGQRGGKIQETRDEITEGKNIGRANETTCAQQALAEAEAQWIKKQKKDYNLEVAKAGEASILIEGGILPMLAKKFSEDGDKIKYPCASQPKLDGHRCLAVVDSRGKCTLWSRTRKAIHSVPHVVAAIEALGIKDITLDGELYNHSYRDKFEELTHFIRQSKPEKGCEIVQYHIYDIVTAADFSTRMAQLEMSVFGRNSGLHPCLVQVETVIVNDEDELMMTFERFLAQRYEGAMARNLAGKYANKRSTDLQKIKLFQDAEYYCSGIEEGRGKLTGHAIFVMRTPEGQEFRAKLKGDTTELKKYFDNPRSVVGHQVTIKFQGISAYGIPRFPVALRVRANI